MPGHAALKNKKFDQLLTEVKNWYGMSSSEDGCPYDNFLVSLIQDQKDEVGRRSLMKAQDSEVMQSKLHFENQYAQVINITNRKISILQKELL